MHSVYTLPHSFLRIRSNIIVPSTPMRCIQKFPEWVDNEIKTTINTRWEATQRVMAAKLTRLTHKIAIQLYIVVESFTICSSRSRRPVRELLDTFPYVLYGRLNLPPWFDHPDDIWRRVRSMKEEFIIIAFTILLDMGRRLNARNFRSSVLWAEECHPLVPPWIEHVLQSGPVVLKSAVKLFMLSFYTLLPNDAWI